MKLFSGGQMKYSSSGVAFVLIMLFSSCIYSQVQSSATPDSLQIFEKYIGALNPNDISTIDKSASRFRQLFEKSSVLTKDTAFIAFWRYYVTVADSLGGRYVQYEKYNSFINIKDFDEPSPKNEKLKQTLLSRNKSLNENDFKILKKINKYGYKFDMIEGVLLVSVADPKFILNNFSGFISQGLKLYITKVIEEIDTAGNPDVETTTSPDELVKRLLWWENFINNNQDFFLIDDCFSTYDGYLYTLMLGTNYNPAFNSADQKLNEKFKMAYEKIINNHKDTRAAAIIKEYYNILKKNNFTNNKEAAKYAGQFLGE